METPIIACLKITKSLKSQAPHGLSGCLDIDNDEINKNNFFRKKCFGLIIVLPNLKTAWASTYIMTLNQIW